MACCPTWYLKLLINVSFLSPQECSTYCNVDCMYSGSYKNACYGCLSELTTCGVNTTRFVSQTVVNRTRASTSGCGAQTCLLCDETRIDSIPANGKLFFSSSCTGFRDANEITPINVYFTGSSLVKPTISIAKNVVVNFHVNNLPFTIQGGADFKCESMCDFNITAPTPCTATQPTAISFVPYPKTAKTMNVAASNVQFHVPAQCECGISMTSSVAVSADRYTTVDGAFYSVANNNGITPFYSVAAGNVAGTVVMGNVNENIILLSSQYAAVTTNVNETRVINVGKLMSVFGSFYEIEFYHDGREYKDKSVIPTVNRYLALILVFCKSLAFANGHK